MIGNSFKFVTPRNNIVCKNRYVCDHMFLCKNCSCLSFTFDLITFVSRCTVLFTGYEKYIYYLLAFDLQMIKKDCYPNVFIYFVFFFVGVGCLKPKVNWRKSGTRSNFTYTFFFCSCPFSGCIKRNLWQFRKFPWTNYGNADRSSMYK